MCIYIYIYIYIYIFGRRQAMPGALSKYEVRERMHANNKQGLCMKTSFREIYEVGSDGIRFQRISQDRIGFTRIRVWWHMAVPHFLSQGPHS